MKIKAFKTLSKYFMKSKDTIIKHGPQIMAVAGVGCFIGATYCAIKETPAAMAKLDEKKALDKNMTTLQKLAVVGPEYKKTAACTAAGIIFTGLSWRFEYKYVGTLLAAISAAEKKSDALVEASKQVVGEEKTDEITTKAADIVKTEQDFGENMYPKPDDCPYLMRFPNGTEMWLTWRQFRRGTDEAMKKAAKDHQLRLSDYFVCLGVDEKLITKYMRNNGWQPDAGQVANCENSDDWLQWAYEIMGYEAELYEIDKYAHIARWDIVWDVNPETWDDDRF